MRTLSMVFDSSAQKAVTMVLHTHFPINQQGAEPNHAQTFVNLVMMLVSIHLVRLHPKARYGYALLPNALCLGLPLSPDHTENHWFKVYQTASTFLSSFYMVRSCIQFH